ncbi:hypothetical protein K438DRAFT_1943236 [Mycena galopus ATCC 62051]|nr:hypothetical protein K438DRAFT_1943236 [Mycena galopus ATCC 62051]
MAGKRGVREFACVQSSDVRLQEGKYKSSARRSFQAAGEEGARPGPAIHAQQSNVVQNIATSLDSTRARLHRLPTSTGLKSSVFGIHRRCNCAGRRGGKSGPEAAEMRRQGRTQVADKIGADLKLGYGIYTPVAMQLWIRQASSTNDAKTRILASVEFKAYRRGRRVRHRMLPVLLDERRSLRLQGLHEPSRAEPTRNDWRRSGKPGWVYPVASEGTGGGQRRSYDECHGDCVTRHESERAEESAHEREQVEAIVGETILHEPRTEMGCTLAAVDSGHKAGTEARDILLVDRRDGLVDHDSRVSNG